MPPHNGQTRQPSGAAPLLSAPARAVVRNSRLKRWPQGMTTASSIGRFRNGQCKFLGVVRVGWGPPVAAAAVTVAAASPIMPGSGSLRAATPSEEAQLEARAERATLLALRGGTTERGAGGHGRSPSGVIGTIAGATSKGGRLATASSTSALATIAVVVALAPAAAAATPRPLTAPPRQHGRRASPVAVPLRVRPAVRGVRGVRSVCGGRGVEGAVPDGRGPVYPMPGTRGVTGVRGVPGGTRAEPQAKPCSRCP